MSTQITLLGESMAGTLQDRHRTVALAELGRASALGATLDRYRERSILIATRAQLSTALALLELDGVARRLVLCTPDLRPDQLVEIAAIAQADFLLVDAAAERQALPGVETIRIEERLTPLSAAREANAGTEWILLTSGTTGTPKLVVHTLESLGGSLPRATATASRPVWSTFYDIRRYGGLQIFLRAMLGGCSLVLSDADEPPDEFLARAARSGVTHISGTPSHWRRALMTGRGAILNPHYVRLSGEIADQTVLDSLRATYPRAQVGHAFASTEAGVAFDVNDGLAGFPMEYVTARRAGVEMKIEDGTLRIRSGRNAQRYLGENPAPIAGGDGYVDTGDLVELQDGRYHFRGRKSGVINVGGLKVHPEEVESVLNADRRVRMSRVRSRRNPITGAVVVADIVLTDEVAAAADPDSLSRVKDELLQACRYALPAHKVPSALRVVASIELTAAGKLVRPSA